jgi:membrane-associated phospholipid phosphatase
LVSVVVVVCVGAVAVVVEVTVCVDVTVSVDGVVVVVVAAWLPVQLTRTAIAPPASNASISRAKDRRRVELTATPFAMPSGHAARRSISVGLSRRASSTLGELPGGLAA